jgi:aldehyde:ferredoxin oxidoreductase
MMEYCGWKGKILRVNLADGKIVKEELPKEWMHQYIGCRGINDIILYREVGPSVLPFSAENKLIFGTGPLDGTPIGMGKISVQTKHEKKFIGEGGAGGFWGPQLKAAGYDFLVIESKSDSPVLLLIDGQKVEIRDAKSLWGLTTREKNRVIRNRYGTDYQVASIGPAGENLVADAKIEITINHSGGRGCGTIMGSKKLAAIAVRGTEGVKVKKPDKYLQAYRKIRKILDLKETIDPFVPAWSFFSANMMLPIFNEEGRLQAYNSQKGTIDGCLNPQDYLVKYVKKPESSFCCPFPACGRQYTVNDEKYGSFSGDEREGGFSLGAALVGVNKWPAVLKFRNLCSAAGLDEFQALYTIAWAMECYERGIINKRDTDGIELNFGNEDAFIRMTQKMISREGFGDILAKGSEEAAKVIGRGSNKYLLTVKGRELEIMPLRTGYQMALALAVSEGGPEHTRWYPPYPPNPLAIPLNIKTPFDPFKAFQTMSTDGKAELVKWLYDSRAVLESMPTCVFAVRSILSIDINPWLDVFNACTGSDFSAEELLKIGERIVNLERAYIVREGFRRRDDTLPRRMLEEPVRDRNFPPIGKNLDIMLDGYYEKRGWDLKTAIPTDAKLRELGLGFAADDLTKIREEELNAGATGRGQK